jgi:hypothetical protein
MIPSPLLGKAITYRTAFLSSIVIIIIMTAKDFPRTQIIIWTADEKKP